MSRPVPSGPMKSGGDDLDDGLELEPGLLASSDAEGSASDGGADDLSDGDLDVDEELDKFGRGDLGDVDVKTDPMSGKRKRVSETALDSDELKAEKKRRKKLKEKERKAKVSFDLQLLRGTKDCLLSTN